MTGACARVVKLSNQLMRPFLAKSVRKFVAAPRALHLPELLRLIISLHMMSTALAMADPIPQRATFSQEREIGFALNDVARMLRTYADQRARDLSMTRAQWAVLVKLQRCEGVKQSELGIAGPCADHAGPADRQADGFGPRRAARRCARPPRQPPLSHGKSRPHVGEARRTRRRPDGPRARRPRARDLGEPAARSRSYPSESKARTAPRSLKT